MKYKKFTKLFLIYRLNVALCPIRISDTLCVDSTRFLVSSKADSTWIASLPFKNYTIYNKLEGLERFHLHVNAPISRACIYILKSSELEVN